MAKDYINGLLDDLEATSINNEELKAELSLILAEFIENVYF